MDKWEPKGAEDKNCGTCRHGTVSPTEMPCVACMTGERWEPKESSQVVHAIGIDPGAPEGDRTNVRLDWGESGPELIGPPVMTEAKKIGYAIDGIRDHAASLGLLLTDKTLSADALANTISALQELSRDWDRLEEEREALRKAAGHVKDRDT